MMPYSETRATAVASFFLEKAGGRLNDLKLMKLLYLSERKYIETANDTITGDNFYSMKNGPVLSNTLRRLSPHLETADPASVWRKHILPANPDPAVEENVELLGSFDFESELSELEIEILAETWNEFGGWTKWQLVEHCHKLPEWTKTTSSIKIHMDEILKAQGLDVTTRIDDQRSVAKLQALVAGGTDERF